MLATEPRLNTFNVRQLSVNTDTNKRRPGRPRVKGVTEELVKNGEAFEKTKDHWTEIALDLISEAKSLTRQIKKNPSKDLHNRLSQVIVQAGIAFDKVEKVKHGGGQDVDIHPFLATQLTSKVSGLQALTAKVALLGEECDRYKMMLQAADEGMIGP